MTGKTDTSLRGDGANAATSLLSSPRRFVETLRRRGSKKVSQQSWLAYGSRLCKFWLRQNANGMTSFVLLLIATVLLAAPLPVQAQDTTSNLFFHWKLDDTSGGTIAEEVWSEPTTWTDGANNDVTEETTAGQVGTAIDFDGDNRVQAPGCDTNALSDLSAATQCNWFYSDINHNNGSMSRFRNPSNDTFFESIVITSSGQIRGEVRLSDNTNYTADSTDLGAGYWNNAWHHVCTVFDQTLSSDRLKLYVDGILVASDNASNNPIDFNNGAVNCRWDIGYDSFGADYFDGRIDDVRFYTRALGPDDINALYENTGPGVIKYNDENHIAQYHDGREWVAMGPHSALDTDGLVGWWRLNETSGPIIKDHSDSGNDGTWADGVNNDVAEETVPGTLNTGLNFDGTNDTIDLGNISELDPGTGDFSVSLWLKMESGTGTSRSVFSKQDSGFGGWNLWIDTDDTDGGAEMNAEGSKITSSIDLRDSTWHHVVVTATTNNLNNWKIYVDGTEDVGTIVAGGTIGSISSSEDARIGARHSSASNFFDGGVDDVRFYNRELSAAEVQALYDRGAPDWTQIGNDLNIATAQDGSIAVLNSTTIAFIEDFANEELRTYSWDGSDWTQVGNGLNIAGINDPFLAALDSSTVAYIDDTNDDLRTYSWDGTDWSQVGNDLNISGVVDPRLTALDSTTVAFIDESNEDLRTYSWDGSDWTQVGNDLNITGSADVGLAALDSDTVAYVGETSDDMRVYDWDGTDWSQVGNSLNISGTVTDPTVAKLDSTTIAYSDGSGDDLRVYKWDGTDWAMVGTELNISGADVSTLRALDPRTLAYFDKGNDDLRTYQFGNHCTNPLRIEGSMIFNTTSDVMQFCDGQDWVAMGPLGDGGVACANPAGTAGEMIFNTTNNIMQYCEGDAWVGVGKPVVPIAVTRTQNKLSTSANPSSVTLDNTPVEGNLLVAIATHRSSSGDISITGSGWTLHTYFNSQSGSSSDRRGLAIWSKIAGAGEPTAITADLGSGNSRLLVQELRIDGGTPVFDVKAETQGGTTDVTSISSGTTATSSTADSLVITGLVTRDAPATAPTWTNGIGNTLGDAASGGLGIYTGYSHDTSAGTKESTASWTTARDASAAIVVFSIVP